MEILSVAIDAQGPERVRPYVEAAGATFPTVVDAENVLGQLFDCKAIPNAVFVDADGIVRYVKRGGFDIRKPEYAQAAEAWAAGTSVEDAATADAGDVASEALEHYREGLDLYREGKAEEAMEAWRRGVALQPDNYIIRKQIWAVENPDRFYQGQVDYAWQKEQLDAGR